jgi:hypothetical protein
MTPHIHSGLIAALATLMATLSAGNALAEELAPAKATAAAVARQQPAPPRKPLDLRPPDVMQLFTSEQLNRILSATFVRDDIEEVEVEGEREHLKSTPDVWPGIAAPFWAVLNPTQAWRIFAPLPPDQTRGMRYAGFNASDAYVLEPAAKPETDY